jgi:SNF2 family DNA or RNA helicase
VLARPEGAEAELHRQLTEFLRRRGSGLASGEPNDESAPSETDEADLPPDAEPAKAAGLGAAISRMQLSSLLAALGSHPAAVAASLERSAAADPEAASLARLAATIGESAKDVRLLDLVQQSQGHKLLIFVNFRRTLVHLEAMFRSKGLAISVFSGERTAHEKDEAGAAFRDRVPIMLCTESGGEGRNLQFADTLINYDLPWNPMKIEQRVGRIHRYGQTREVFVFNLCTADSLEARILKVLNDKIRMFELVVGEVGSILGNLEDGDQFESLVLDLWLRSRDEAELERSFATLGETLLEAQEQYVQAKELDEALFGEDFQ